MAYQIYRICRDGLYDSTDYGTYIKSVADEIASTVPGITLESITTDTESTYDAIYSIEGMTSCKLRIYNDTNNAKMYIKIGNDVNYISGSSSNEDRYFYKAGNITGYNPLYIEIIVSDGMYFMIISFPGNQISYNKLIFGLLTSKVDDSKIEVRFFDANGRVMKNGYGNKTIFFSCPTIGDFQRGILSLDEVYLIEGSLYTNSADASMAPYGINGHSIYASWFRNGDFTYFITDGVDCFFCIGKDTNGSSFNFRLT